MVGVAVACGVLVAAGVFVGAGVPVACGVSVTAGVAEAAVVLLGDASATAAGDGDDVAGATALLHALISKEPRHRTLNDRTDREKRIEISSVKHKRRRVTCTRRGGIDMARNHRKPLADHVGEECTMNTALQCQMQQQEQGQRASREIRAERQLGLPRPGSARHTHHAHHERKHQADQ